MNKLLIIIILVGNSFIGYTQEQDSATYKKNVVKFLPVNISLNSISFEYERMIDPNYSLSLGIGIPIQGSIIGKYGIDDHSNLKKADFSSMHLRAALRYYTGNKMLPKGFYIEPYLKYQHINADAKYEGLNNLNNTYKGDLTAKLNTYNLGVQIGYQFLISNTVTIDLYFLGLEGGLAFGKITSTSISNPSDANDIEADIKKTVADLPFFIKNWLTVTKENNQVFVEANKLQYPWYRAGFSIGIAF